MPCRSRRAHVDAGRRGRRRCGRAVPRDAGRGATPALHALGADGPAVLRAGLLCLALRGRAGCCRAAGLVVAAAPAGLSAIAAGLVRTARAGLDGGDYGAPRAAVARGLLPEVRRCLRPVAAATSAAGTHADGGHAAGEGRADGSSGRGSGLRRLCHVRTRVQARLWRARSAIARSCRSCEWAAPVRSMSGRSLVGSSFAAIARSLSPYGPISAVVATCVPQSTRPNKRACGNAPTSSKADGWQKEPPLGLLVGDAMPLPSRPITCMASAAKPGARLRDGRLAGLYTHLVAPAHSR